jgi:hypothetical protein
MRPNNDVPDHRLRNWQRKRLDTGALLLAGMASVMPLGTSLLTRWLLAQRQYG